MNELRRVIEDWSEQPQCDKLGSHEIDELVSVLAAALPSLTAEIRKEVLREVREALTSDEALFAVACKRIGIAYQEKENGDFDAERHARELVEAALATLTGEVDEEPGRIGTTRGTTTITRAPIDEEACERCGGGAQEVLAWAVAPLDGKAPVNEHWIPCPDCKGQVDEAGSSEGITGVEYWKSRAEEAERDLADTDWAELLDAAMEAGQKKGIPLQAFRDRLEGAS